MTQWSMIVSVAKSVCGLSVLPHVAQNNITNVILPPRLQLINFVFQVSYSLKKVRLVGGQSSSGDQMKR